MTIRARYAGALAALVVLLAGCGDGDPAGRPTASQSATDPAGTPSTTAPTSPSAETPHPADDPLVLDPAPRILDWQPIDGPVSNTVTTNGEWTLTVNQAGDRADLEGPTSASGSGSSGERVSDAFLDDDWAVVVHQDRQEQDPSRAVVTNLATGKEFTIDGGSDIPTTTGGTWALGGGHLLHATIGADGSYCLASVDLTTRTSSLGWCAEKRHGFNGAHITPFGDSLMSFDDSQPSCRTVAAVSGTQLEPLPGVTDCKGWDGVITEDGAVWSVVAKDSRVEAAHFYARSGDSYVDLGPGTSGTLTWCHGTTYFVRDPQRDGEPARLMAYDAEGLTIAYESPAGQAFLTEPRCGGDTMNVTALAESGDEQVSAALG
ncbi:hypothetical protein [Nocardioides sp.]|uniref:hypothetical protein n=1 Tax=Nocardioides sp. TaxID=35761 RepID=UPI0031FF03F0|nr:hypothetical protein [Nocardioides sp.]